MSFYEDWKQTVTAKKVENEQTEFAGKTAAELFVEKSNNY